MSGLVFGFSIILAAYLQDKIASCCDEEVKIISPNK